MASLLTPQEQELLEKLCSILCGPSELVELMGYPQDELEARVSSTYDKTLDEVRMEYAAVGKRNLRAAQMKSALDGNTTMQIWLGKQYLGQSDSPQQIEVSQQNRKPAEVTPFEVIQGRRAERRKAAQAARGA